MATVQSMGRLLLRKISWPRRSGEHAQQDDRDDEHGANPSRRPHLSRPRHYAPIRSGVRTAAGFGTPSPARATPPRAPATRSGQRQPGHLGQLQRLVGRSGLLQQQIGVAGRPAGASSGRCRSRARPVWSIPRSAAAPSRPRPAPCGCPVRRPGSRRARNACRIGSRHPVVQRRAGQLIDGGGDVGVLGAGDVGVVDVPGQHADGGRAAAPPRSAAYSPRATLPIIVASRSKDSRNAAQCSKSPARRIFSETRSDQRARGAVAQQLVPGLDVVKRPWQQPGQRGADQQVLVVAGELLARSSRTRRR